MLIQLTIHNYVIAEELEIEWDKLDVVQVGTGQGLDDSSGTGGSTSVSALYLPLREAGATLREMLRAEAAKHFGCVQCCHEW